VISSGWFLKALGQRTTDPSAAGGGMAILSEVSYLLGMKGITVKIPEATLRRLKEEARATGRSVASLVRERVETPGAALQGSVYAKTPDLAGSVAGSRRSATNDRHRFRRR